MVLDKSFGAPAVTKDGVSVAKEIELKDKFENMGAQMVKEVASQNAKCESLITWIATSRCSRKCLKNGGPAIAVWDIGKPTTGHSWNSQGVSGVTHALSTVHSGRSSQTDL